MEISTTAIVVIMLLVIIFGGDIFRTIDSGKSRLMSMINGKEHLEESDLLVRQMHKPFEPMSGQREYLDATGATPDTLGLPPGQTSDVLTVLGHTGQQPWGEVIKATELDPSTFVNHNEFVKDVRRFSSGANFTSVADDNTSSDFVNYVGLRRPTHVPIGESARQQPDVDQSVLERNQRFSWNDGPNFSTKY